MAIGGTFLITSKKSYRLALIAVFFPIIAGLFKIAQHTYIRPLCPLRPTRQDIQHAVCPVWLTHNCAFGILGPTKSKFLSFIFYLIVLTRHFNIDMQWLFL
jgi:hypothetical protein